MPIGPSPLNAAEPAEPSLVACCWRLFRPNKTLEQQRTLWLSPISPASTQASSATLAGRWPAASSPLAGWAFRVDPAMSGETQAE
jgi:hypothetical protein